MLRRPKHSKIEVVAPKEAEAAAAAISIIYSECVFVSLVIGLAKRMRYVMLSVASLAV